VKKTNPNWKLISPKQKKEGGKKSVVPKKRKNIFRHRNRTKEGPKTGQRGDYLVKNGTHGEKNNIRCCGVMV